MPIQRMPGNSGSLSPWGPMFPNFDYLPIRNDFNRPRSLSQLRG